MEGRRTRRVLGYGSLVLVAGAVWAWILVFGRFDLILYAILFTLVGGVGVANLRGWHQYVPKLMLAVAVLSVLLGVGRMSHYGPSNALVIAFFALAAAFLVRGYQYRLQLQKQ
ncbi:hypothetical protein [Haladaptatus sp. NG-WS-4]